MNKPTRITAEVDPETLAMVEQLARQQGQSTAEFAAEAIRRVAESETDYRAFLQEGIDAIHRGDVIPHAEVMAELDGMIEQHRQRCRN